jgi:hypothetical protein
VLRRREFSRRDAETQIREGMQRREEEKVMIEF